MKLVTAVNLRTGIVSTYRVPTRKQIFKNYDATAGEKWCPIERERVSGGIPLVWEKVSP